jgi:hypothetical protein
MDIAANIKAAENATIAVDRNGLRHMPKEYQDVVTHLMLVHTEGELTGADDYVQLFLSAGAERI